MFYDAHTHFIGQEAGGILVGLEGGPWFEENSAAFCVPGKILHNDEAAAIAAAKGGYLFFRYVTGKECLECLECLDGLEKGCDHVKRQTSNIKLLKFHPRREKYTPDQVIGAIGKMRPKAVMIDTLNEPNWVAYDYWKVCRAYPKITFLLPHAGGYQINEFIKICHFQRNVYIDFTLTHTNFGGISKNPLPYVDQAIWYALNAPFRDRVLMGSDLPFFNQMDVVGYYERLGKLEMLNGNFERLYENLTCNAQ